MGKSAATTQWETKQRREELALGIPGASTVFVAKTFMSSGASRMKTDDLTVQKTLNHVIQEVHVVVRCLASERDSQDSSQRALLLLVDILGLLYHIKDEVSSSWSVDVNRSFDRLYEVLVWFEATTKSMESYFQPGGVGVCYFRKCLLQDTFLPQLEQYKTAFLLWMQSDSCERTRLDREIRSRLRRYQDAVPASLQFDLEFEEDALGPTSRLASEQFIMFTDLCNRRHQGSCQWILEDVEYKRWLLGSFRTLNCIGPPGAGKTYLSSVIIDSLQRTFTSSDVATVFIYCQDGKEKEQASVDLLRSILAQLVYRKRSLSHATSSLYYSESVKKGQASSKAYQNAIRAEVNRFSKVFLVIDGLDASPDKDRTIGRLQRLPRHAQLLLTLREAPRVDNGSCVQVQASREDLQSYVAASIETGPRLSHLFRSNGDMDHALLWEVVRCIVESSHGVFLLTKIHLELLSRYTECNLLGRALHHLPQSLGEAYGEAMKQMISFNPRAARYVYWTLYALRPLTVAELQSATQISETDQESAILENSLQTKSAGLLTVDSATGTVRFVHKTAKEYLQGVAARVFFPTAQKEITETCLTAITPDEVIDSCYPRDGAMLCNPGNGITDYAATYWGYHAREVTADENAIQVLVRTFLNKLLWRRPPAGKSPVAAEMPMELGLGKYPRDWSALHILAFFGIVGKAKRLLEQGASIDANDNSYKVTPLHCAVARGNDDMVEFLLDSGVNYNASCLDGNTALHMATRNGQRKTMKLLLSQPVDPQIANLQGANCLQLAVGTASDESTVPLLVKNRAGVNSRNLRNKDTALHLAVEWKRPRIILFLLEKGAVLNMANGHGFTPLQLAAKIDNCEAISLLLQRGAQLETRSLPGYTAVQIAAQHRNWVAFDLLVAGGANVNAWTKEGETLLHGQARESFSSTSIAAKLLDQGANIEARSSRGDTALQCAAMAGNKTMVMFLVSQGANIDVLTPKGESLLHITPPLNNDCLDILSALIVRGLDVQTVSNEGWMPLHKIVYTGTGALDLESDKTREYIELLRRHGADINAFTTPPIAETPLHLATRASICRPQLISFLISLGANLNAMTNEGKTPLHLAGERGRESVFRILLEAGTNLFLEIPEEVQKTTTPMDLSAGSTAFDLARKNPFSVIWLDGEGKLCPAPERKRRDSVDTIIDDIETDDLDDGMTGSTLVGSDRRAVFV